MDAKDRGKSRDVMTPARTLHLGNRRAKMSVRQERNILEAGTPLIKEYEVEQ
jgi:hypothetical protein